MSTTVREDKVSDKKDQSHNINSITLSNYIGYSSNLCNMSTTSISGSDNISITTGDSWTAAENDTLTSGSIYTSDTITLGAATDGQYSYTSSPIYTIYNIPGYSHDPEKTVLKTSKNEIDLDELADLMKILKKRLLIIAPDFEKHEKYPMLKQLYDEYKALERLLSGPDSDNDNE